MKLLDISVKNFRSIKGDGITLSLKDSDIIFIFGQNNAGKSSLLSAYEYMVSPKKKAVLNDFLGFDASIPIEIKVTFIKEEGDNELFESKGFNKWVDGEGKLKFRKTFVSVGEEGKKETFDPCDDINDFVVNGFGGLEQHLTKHSPTPVRIPAFPTPADLTKFIKETVQKSVLKSLKEDEVEAYEKVMLEINSLQQRILTKEVIVDKSSKANENFQKIFPNLTLDISPIEGQEFDLASTFEKEFSVIIKDDRFPNTKQDFSDHGHGVIRQALFNFLGIVKNELPSNNDGGLSKEFIILFEEPEVYLHPKAIKLLRKMLYELCTDSPFQIICASHSPSLIDISKPHTTLVRLIRDNDAISKLFQVGEDLFSASSDIKNKVQMANRFDPNVCESFFSDEVILVEGDTEAIVVRELLERKFPDKDIYVVNTGSKNNIPFFQKIFNHFNIKQHIIHDSDTRFLYNKSKTNDGEIEYILRNNNDGTPKNNSAWTINENIWVELNKGNNSNEGLSKRYVSVYDFESSHAYKYDKEKGKPLSAFEYANNLNLEGDESILNFIRMICGEIDKTIEFTPEELDSLVIEPNLK